MFQYKDSRQCGHPLLVFAQPRGPFPLTQAGTGLSLAGCSLLNLDPTLDSTLWHSYGSRALEEAGNSTSTPLTACPACSKHTSVPQSLQANAGSGEGV